MYKKTKPNEQFPSITNSPKSQPTIISNSNQIPVYTN